MASPSKRKGDDFERHVAGLLTDMLGFPVRRALGAGRLDDVGDLDGIPGWALQCKAYKELSRAVGDVLRELPDQMNHRGVAMGAGIVKRPGSLMPFACIPLDVFATVIRETL